MIMQSFLHEWKQIFAVFFQWKQTTSFNMYMIERRRKEKELNFELISLWWNEKYSQYVFYQHSYCKICINMTSLFWKYTANILTIWQFQNIELKIRFLALTISPVKRALIAKSLWQNWHDLFINLYSRGRVNSYSVKPNYKVNNATP